MKYYRLVRCACLILLLGVISRNFAQKPPALAISSEPNAIVWIDEVRRGTTDVSGKLLLSKLAPGHHSVRVRATGFKESTTPLLPGRRAISIKLTPTTDEAELLFQQAETAREKARDEEARQKAVDIYEQALKLRDMPAAHLGLARLFMDLNEYDDALEEIAAARKIRPSYPEASAVEGRIYRERALTDASIKSFRRAIREGRGFQPEAHVGLARVYEDKSQFSDAVIEYEKAIAQLSESEPVIYQLLGAAYEKLNKPKEAVVAYEKYLELAPNGSYATAIRSILDQLKREAAGEQIIP